MRKILFVADTLYPSPGDAEFAMHLLLERLGACGFQTAARTWRPHTSVELADVVSSTRPEWVFTQGRIAPNVVREAQGQGRKTAVFVHRLTDHLWRFRSFGCLAARPDVAAQCAMFRTADGVVCNSAYTRRVIERTFHRADAVVEYPLVAGPRTMGLSRHRYLTLLCPEARPARRLFEELVRLLPEYQFLVVGGDELDVPSDRVAHLPAVTHIDEVYRATRILLHPAVAAEGFSRDVAEAAAHGVPSVVARRGGLPEALGAGGLVVVDVENPEAWAKAVREVDAGHETFARHALAHSQTFRRIDTVLALLQSPSAGACAAA